MTHPPTTRVSLVSTLACAAVLAALLPAAAQAAPSSPAARPRLLAPQGTTVLPNLDDDTRRCTLRPGDLDRLDVAVDERLAACNDAADEVVNGAADLQDLTPLRVPPTAVGARTGGRVSVPAAQGRYARIFVERGGRYVSLGTGGRLGAGELRKGVRLAVEGRDVVRDAARWDGRIDVTLALTDGGTTRTASVRLRVAPVLLQHDLQRARHVFAAAPGPGEGQPVEVPVSHRKPGGWKEFAGSLRAATRASGLPDRELRFQPGTAQWWRDVWRQDIAEPGYVTKRTPEGTRTMRILLRSPNYWTSADGRAASLRRAGRLLYRDLRGPGVGVVQQYTTRRDKNVDELLNFTGNIEKLPPYPGRPQGRILYGSAPERRPDPSFVTLLRSQGRQEPLALDTSWLLVGHVDETVHVVRADTARGWTLAFSDPRLAMDLMRRAQRSGQGGQRLFADTDAALKPTVDQVLRHERTTGENEEAARRIDGQLAVLLRATGLRKDELVGLPVLYVKEDAGNGKRRHMALSPALANGLSLTARDFAPPAPHGPRVGGRDLFRDEAERRLAAKGVRTHWVEDFSWAHLGGGEVHCATNALRQVP
ncbi:protein-arginine deiminase family protein [Streptomyces sp. I05A-00742]|uniref:protein-arginine deiminase family protein n=1 Tax=Streptomyces sp. I05A-00742 TaxID=2732853 RepID=UPI001487CB18|nr:protein-arginine deiminase family protein [Streptomyces sp. I05A-00742]